MAVVGVNENAVHRAAYARAVGRLVNAVAADVPARTGLVQVDAVGAARAVVIEQVVVQDAEEADRTFDMLMGSEVAPRKSFIQSNAKMANLDI